MVELDFQSKKMDLFDFKLRFGVSRSHSVKDKSTVWNVYIFRIPSALAAELYRKSPLRANRPLANCSIIL